MCFAVFCTVDDGIGPKPNEPECEQACRSKTSELMKVNGHYLINSSFLIMISNKQSVVKPPLMQSVQAFCSRLCPHEIQPF